MKRIFNYFLSSKATIILLVIIGVAMAIATYIEDKYDTVTARTLVYNTRWFELIFILLAINLFGHIKAYHLFSRKRIGGLVFHLSFLLLIIGAGITRYFGFEGSMHIRKGEASNVVFSSDPYLTITYSDRTYDFPINIGAVNNNKFHVSIPSDAKGNIEIQYKEIITNAVEQIEENVPGGMDMLELSVATNMGLQRVLLKKGEIKDLGKNKISYLTKAPEAINIAEIDGKLSIISPNDMLTSNMEQTDIDSLKQDSIALFKEKYIYNTHGTAFLFSKHFKSAIIKLVPATKEPEGMGAQNNGVEAVILDINISGKTYQAGVANNTGNAYDYQDFNFADTHLKIGFGNKPVELPFSLILKDFILEKYPGSESPSSYKSEVELVDNRSSLREDHSIYMNHVLDYDHYRFFQSSYDNDQQGTILSVNHDFWGTLVSYLGYTLLGIGFLIALFSKNSRFHSVIRQLNESIRKRKSLTLTFVLALGLSTHSFSQETTNGVVDAKHAEKVSQLLCPTFDGRLAPVHTLAIDVVHKMSKRENLNIEGKGKLNAMQIFIGMIIEPEFWQKQKIIYIPQQSIRDLIGIDSEYASFLDFFDARNGYKLEKQIAETFRKKQNEKNKFDKELLKVDERVNIFNMIINGSILKIFPLQDSKEGKWISWDDKAAMIPLTGSICVINQDLHLKSLSYNFIMQEYVFSVLNATKTNDYSRADKIVGYISDIQKQFSDPNQIPSESKIKMEIFYNKADIFILLKNLFSVLSILLLIIGFIDITKANKSKIISYSYKVLSIILILGFLYHSLGMALRWYITGHAPWSNGYEALILVAWGALLAGFCFARYLKLILGATTLLAFLVLMTASHSSYDPQLTNLQPVLKSYWLIIHVATLTISYGFLGLGFILAIMNLFIYLIKNKNNFENLELVISIITNVIEMLLIIGLVLATLGTFLGAVWANESWGKYWGWDAKETWALIIVITYSIVIHMRFIPKLNGKFAFNVASVLGFSSVLMTFIGVNYYLSKGMHSYGAGDTPIFPLWAWGTIFAIFALIIAAGFKEKNNNIDPSKNDLLT